MQTQKLGGDLVAFVAMAKGKNMEQSGTHVVLCKPSITFFKLITSLFTNSFILTIPIFDKWHIYNGKSLIKKK